MREIAKPRREYQTQQVQPVAVHDDHWSVLSWFPAAGGRDCRRGPACSSRKARQTDESLSQPSGRSSRFRFARSFAKAIILDVGARVAPPLREWERPAFPPPEFIALAASAPGDCEHTQTGTRLEIKQAAARQSWDHESTAVRRRPVFDIAARQGYWPRDGGPWIEAPGRLAHLYVFAWHGGHDEHADHRNAEQWQFLVTAESDLPSGQKSIGLAQLEEIATRCGIAELRQVIEMARQRLTIREA